MQINLNTSNHNSKPVFTAVKLLPGGEETLRQTLKTTKDISIFNNIVEGRISDKYADLYLSGNGQRLTAKIIDKQSSTEETLEKVSQKFWQSTVSFLEKVNKKTIDAENSLSRKAESQKRLDAIISKTDKV